MRAIKCISLIGILEGSLLQLTLSDTFIWITHTYTQNKLLVYGRLMENYIWMLLKFSEEYVNSQISITFEIDVNTCLWSSFFFCAGKS